MVWQIVNGCDFEKAKIPLISRSPYLEMEAIVTDNDKMVDDPNPAVKEMMKKLLFRSVDFVEELPSPRHVSLLFLLIKITY